MWHMLYASPGHYILGVSGRGAARSSGPSASPDEKQLAAISTVTGELLPCADSRIGPAPCMW